MTENDTESLTIVEPPKPKPAGRAKGDTRGEQARRKRVREALENDEKQRRARVKAGMALIEEDKAKGESAFLHTNVPDTVEELIDRMTNEAAWRPETRVLHGVMDLNGPLADASDGPTALVRGDAVETVNGVVKREAFDIDEPVLTKEALPPVAPETPSIEASAPEAVFERWKPEPLPDATPTPARASATDRRAYRDAPRGRFERALRCGLTWCAIAVTAAAVGWYAGATTRSTVAVLDVDRVKTAVLDRAKTQSLERTYRALDAFDGWLAMAVAELLREQRLVLIKASAVIGVSNALSDVTPEVTHRVLERLNALEPGSNQGEAP